MPYRLRGFNSSIAAKAYLRMSVDGTTPTSARIEAASA
jgi:hypothetical protein